MGYFFVHLESSVSRFLMLKRTERFLIFRNQTFSKTEEPNPNAQGEFEEETGLEGESELNLPGRSGACMHGSKAYLRPVIERTRETDRESDPSSQ